MNQRKRQNGRRSITMTKSSRNNVLDVEVVFSVACIPGGLATDRATGHSQLTSLPTELLGTVSLPRYRPSYWAQSVHLATDRATGHSQLTLLPTELLGTVSQPRYWAQSVHLATDRATGHSQFTCNMGIICLGE